MSIFIAFSPKFLCPYLLDKKSMMLPGQKVQMFFFFLTTEYTILDTIIFLYYNISLFFPIYIT